MNRTIKFRAWDGLRMTNSGIMFNTSLGEVEVPEGSRMKLMQFINQHDINGKDIYEGDIVDCKGRICEVKYGMSQFYVQQHETGNIFNIPQYSENIEVIGNIYETPNKLI